MSTQPEAGHSGTAATLDAAVGRGRRCLEQCWPAGLVSGPHVGLPCRRRSGPAPPPACSGLQKSPSIPGVLSASGSHPGQCSSAHELSMYKVMRVRVESPHQHQELATLRVQCQDTMPRGLDARLARALFNALWPVCSMTKPSMYLAENTSIRDSISSTVCETSTTCTPHRNADSRLRSARRAMTSRL